MSFKQFITSLVPSFTKETAIDDCRITISEIKEATLPGYLSAEPFFKKWKLKNSTMKTFERTFENTVKEHGNMFTVITKSLKTTVDNLEYAIQTIEKTYNEEMAGVSLTYHKANLLRFVEIASFVSKYARRFLDYAYLLETSEVQVEGEVSAAFTLSKAETDWLDANFMTFCSSINTVSINPGAMKSKMDAIPDIEIVADNEQTLSSTIGKERLDPLKMNLIPVVLNPIYHIRMAIAEWQAKRYRNAKEELRLIQLRKMNLEELTRGKPDAKVQKEIVYLENRIQEMRDDIREMEEKYA